MAFDNTLYCGKCDAWYGPEDLIYDEKRMVFCCKKHNIPCLALKESYERYIRAVHPVLGNLDFLEE